MNISLTSELEQMVQEKVASGMYSSASEVIREGLRLLKERDLLQAMKLQELRAEIRKGIDSGEPTLLDIEAVIRRGQERMATQEKLTE
ncbi:MAG: type II toxin-antitoxin system ParD family antitoxin [Leptolyngbyaceae cyanobacterium RM1_405_57]|nr:type II toxin-antitoxin system ParD family antitoxin [Leptolyngbyaceae cyanobacterium RM1_405_57]